ncbi:DUF2798 domain-containing protein [Puniceibacterium confluentis]|uniref:DUF2798 domain-containing protein n=1 Tax=Puniceibacterium confluentis TaxID=1958944 RepID=UPI0011B4349B|nr:DUF2798 domain-containing protein [Puniceibacterium confluentis]
MTDSTFTHAPQTKRSVSAKIAIALSVMAPVVAILTGVMTWANTGFGNAFLADWSVSFLKAVFVLMPFALIVMGLLARVIESALPRVSHLGQNLVLAIFMAFVMQSLMAGITAGTTAGFGDAQYFASLWWNALVTSFPVGLAMPLVMTTLIRPRLIAILRS